MLPDNTNPPQWAQYFGAAFPLFLALTGGIVRKIWDGECSWKSMFAGTITGAFVGGLVHYGLQGVDWPNQIEVALVGASSFLGGDLIKVAFSRACDAALGTVKVKK